MSVRTVRATRYVMPLREGGSLPAIVEADDDGLYVVKFRGAGQGTKALIAELIAGEIGRVLGLPMPEIVFVDLSGELARTEPDPEIQELLRASAGLNLALEYLPGSVMFDPVVDKPDADLASAIVWFDALITNVDRTPRNTNMLTWHKKLWLIDHGAALYFHHAHDNYPERSGDPFTMVANHVLLPLADSIEKIDPSFTARLTRDTLEPIIGMLPDAWLQDNGMFADPKKHRNAYLDYFVRRLVAPRHFVKEALRARSLSL